VGLLRVDPEWRFPGAAEWVNWLKPRRSHGQIPKALELSAEFSFLEKGEKNIFVLVRNEV